MKNNLPPAFSRITSVAVSSLGSMIKNCRLERGMSQQDLADRINISRYSIIALEKGDPKVAIGVVFEAAHIVGVPLLADTIEGVKQLSINLTNLRSVLPKRAVKQKWHDED